MTNHIPENCDYVKLFCFSSLLYLFIWRGQQCSIKTSVTGWLYSRESLFSVRRGCFGAAFLRTGCSCLNSLQRLSWKRINFQSSQDWVKHPSNRTVILKGPEARRLVRLWVLENGPDIVCWINEITLWPWHVLLDQGQKNISLISQGLTETIAQG